jgi:hypothetical protein
MLNALSEGFQYLFQDNRQLRDDRTPRAGFAQQYSWPINSVQGGGQLVGPQPGMSAGKYWQVTQPRQVVQIFMPVPTSPLAGGQMAGMMYGQPLIDTTAMG